MSRSRRRSGSHRVPHPPGTASSCISASTSTCSSRAPCATVGAATLRNIGKNAENQDTCGACSAGSSKNFIGVFDGHGEMGHRISRFACDALQRNLFDNSSIGSDPKMALARAYRETQSQILSQHGEDAAFSGTTAVSAYQDKKHLYVANVGDSRAVIGRCGTGMSRSSQSSLRAIDLSCDQKPDREDERCRIEKQGGKIGQSLFPMHNLLGGVSFVPAGPARVLGPDGSGLAMSRSLGDANYHPHVIGKPEIHERKLDSRDKLLILGSDGVWDQMSSQEAVSIARRHKDPSTAAKHITDVSRRRWAAETNNTLSDDITAVVMRFDHRGRTSGAHHEVDRGASCRAVSERFSGRHSSSSRSRSLFDNGPSLVAGAPKREPPFAAAGRRVFA